MYCHVNFLCVWRGVSSLAKTVSSPGEMSPHVSEGLKQLVAVNSSSYLTVAALLSINWGMCPDVVLEKLTNVLNEQPVYEEVVPFLLSLQKDCLVSTIACLFHFNVHVYTLDIGSKICVLSQKKFLATIWYSVLLSWYCCTMDNIIQAHNNLHLYMYPACTCVQVYVCVQIPKFAYSFLYWCDSCW